jgi:hypothetical protein
MARRPVSIANDAMTREQLAELERGLSRLAPEMVRERFKNAADRCRFLELPSPRVVQELVAAWKILWRWRK